MDLQLNGTACVVTGGSKGIGLAVALELAAEGADVLLVARNQKALDEAATAVREAGGRAHTLSVDLFDPDVADRVWNECTETFGRPEVLVHCAGSTLPGAPDELTDEQWHKQLDDHVMVPMRLLRRFVPAMATHGAGRVVLLSSASGKRPQVRNAAYSVAKAAQLSLARVFADAYARDGVRVNSVTPGPVDTDMWHAEGGLADAQAAAAGISREELLQRIADDIPTGRFAAPEQIAAVVALLCSPRADAVSGAAWSVDGGSVRTIV